MAESKTETLVRLLDELVTARLSGDVLPLDHLVRLEEAFDDAVVARVEERERLARRDDW